MPACIQSLLLFGSSGLLGGLGSLDPLSSCGLSLLAFSLIVDVAGGCRSSVHRLLAPICGVLGRSRALAVTARTGRRSSTRRPSTRPHTAPGGHRRRAPPHRRACGGGEKHTDSIHLARARRPSAHPRRYRTGRDRHSDSIALRRPGRQHHRPRLRSARARRHSPHRRRHVGAVTGPSHSTFRRACKALWSLERRRKESTTITGRVKTPRANIRRGLSHRSVVGSKHRAVGWSMDDHNERGSRFSLSLSCPRASSVISQPTSDSCPISRRGRHPRRHNHGDVSSGRTRSSAQRQTRKPAAEHDRSGHVGPGSPRHGRTRTSDQLEPDRPQADRVSDQIGGKGNG